MTKLIGMSRLIQLAVVILINLIVGAAYVFYLQPVTVQAQTDLSSIDGEVASLRERVTGIKAEMEAFNANYARYQDLEKSGFLSNQDRFAAGRKLDELRGQAGLIGFAYDIEAVTPVTNVNAEMANMTLIRSQVKFNKVSSVLDSNVYDFIGRMLREFPQHVRLERFEVRRAAPVSEENLQQVSGGNFGFTEGAINIDWFTIISKDAVVKQDNMQAPVSSDAFRGR